MPRSEYQRYYLQAMAIDLYASKIGENTVRESNIRPQPSRNAVKLSTDKPIQTAAILETEQTAAILETEQTALSLADLTHDNLVADICCLLAVTPEQIKQTSARAFQLGNIQWLISPQLDTAINYQSGQLITGPLQTLHSVTNKKQLWLVLGSRQT